MGILNVTPDSFSDGGRHDAVDAALARARELVVQGADILDVGGESTRPGARPVSEEEEASRVLPVVERVVGLGVPVSVDTRKPAIARAALELGAHMINDVSGLGDEMLTVAQEFDVPAIAMHMQGTPETMQESPRYGDVVAEVVEYLSRRQRAARTRGVQVVLDPGIGFGKTLEHNLDLLRQLGRLRRLGSPVLIGLSRKGFLGQLTGLEVDQRLEATIAANTIAVLHGADIVRVHDVEAHRRAIPVADALRYRPTLTRSERVYARGVRCRAHIGVGEAERRMEQELVIDVEVELDREGAPSADLLDETVDYERLASLAREVAAERPRQLLEVLAEELVSRLLHELPVREVRVRVEKPAVARAHGGGGFGVEVVRHR
jgi:dihydropteroate synthase